MPIHSMITSPERARFEAVSGFDLGHVRVHTDGSAVAVWRGRDYAAITRP